MSQDDFLEEQRRRTLWPWVDESGVAIVEDNPLFDHADLHYFFDALISTTIHPRRGSPIPLPEHKASLTALKFTLQKVFGPLTGYGEAPGIDDFEDQIVRSDLGIAVALIATFQRPQSDQEHQSYVCRIDALGDSFITNASAGPTYARSIMPEGLINFITNYALRNNNVPPSGRYEHMATCAVAYKDLYWEERDIKVYQYLIHVVAPLCEEIVMSDHILNIPEETKAFFLMHFKDELRDELENVIVLADALENSRIQDAPPDLWPDYGPGFNPLA